MRELPGASWPGSGTLGEAAVLELELGRGQVGAQVRLGGRDLVFGSVGSIALVTAATSVLVSVLYSSSGAPLQQNIPIFCCVSQRT